jgi:hypothetical protein
MSAVEDATLWNKLKNFMGGTVVKTITEINMLMPDSILFGSLLLYFLTQNISFGVFAVFIFETVLSHKLVSWISSQATGPSGPTAPQCRPGFKTPQFKPERMFSHDTYPSYAVYSITSIATYLGLATSTFGPTMDAMGPDWASRKTIAYTFIGLVLIAFLSARAWSCESMGEIVMAALIAIVSAAIFFSINKSIFGDEAMNFLGLPYMVSKESQGAPIYVCSKEETDNTK